MLRAVTFDLWETLIHEDAGAESVRRDLRIRGVMAILERYGLKPAREAMEKAHHDVVAKMDAYWSSYLDTSVVEQVKHFIEIGLGHSVDGRLPPAALLECSKLYGEAALHHPPKPADGAQAVLMALKASGLGLGLISNTGRTPGKVLREILQRFGMHTSFEAMSFSDETRLRKPAKDVFLAVLKRIGVEPFEAAHVGDQSDTDVSGARDAGMKTIHLRHPKAAATTADYEVASIKELPALLGKLTIGLDRNRTHFGHDTVAYE